jgi:hypothetical protein
MWLTQTFYTTGRGKAIRGTTTGSALVGVFGIPGLRSLRLLSPVGFRPGMRMAPRKELRQPLWHGSVNSAEICHLIFVIFASHPDPSGTAASR